VPHGIRLGKTTGALQNVGAEHGVGAMSADDREVALLVERIEADIPKPWPKWPGGWVGKIEAALLDAVLGIRANYGQEHNGVRGAIARWRTHRAGSQAELDDLHALADTTADDLVQVLQNKQKVSGRPKAILVQEAAQALLKAGIRRADDATARPAEAQSAYTSVRGLGDVTAAYFLMLLGQPGVKADTWVQRFVAQAVGRKVPAAEAEQLLIVAAARLDVYATDLDYAVWSHVRNRP
jgi:hypothetical protein